MTVKEFCDGYKKQSIEKQKEEWVRKAVKADYVPLAVKVNRVKEAVIVSNCKEDGTVFFNSVKQYLLHTYMLMDLYTNIDVTPSAWNDEYDELNRLGLIGMLTAMMPQTELAEIQMLQDLIYDDFIENHNSVKSWVGKQIEKFWGQARALLGEVSEDLKKVNWEKLVTKS